MFGTIVYWNRERDFGFIETKDDNRKERFFLHSSKISSCESAQPEVNDLVIFEIDRRRSVRVGDLRFAVNAAVYKTSANMIDICRRITAGERALALQKVVR